MQKVISDEEKARILERVRFEIEIRDELKRTEKEKPKARRWSWLESKLALLIIGAVMSGILVPLFQFTQETIKWTRQNRYDNLMYRVEMVRSGMRELTFVHAFVAEAYERTYSLLSVDAPGESMMESYRTQMLQMHNRRFVQNAKFVSYLSYLPEREREAAREAFQQYLSSVQALMTLLDGTTGSRDETGRPSVGGGGGAEVFDDAVQDQIEEIDTDYEQVLGIMRSYLGRLENESVRYM